LDRSEEGCEQVTKYLLAVRLKKTALLAESHASRGYRIQTGDAFETLLAYRLIGAAKARGHALWP
jgi:hypothetical protein